MTAACPNCNEQILDTLPACPNCRCNIHVEHPADIRGVKHMPLEHRRGGIVMRAFHVFIVVFFPRPILVD